MISENGQIKNLNAYGYLLTEAFDRLSRQPEPGMQPVRFEYDPKDLSLLSGHVDGILYDMENSLDPRQRRMGQALKRRFVLRVSPVQEGPWPLTNDYPIVGASLQRALRSGELIEGQYGVKPAQAREVTDRGLRFLALTLYQTPFLDEFFPDKNKP